MAFPQFSDPSLFVAGPNGLPIPKQFAPTFGIVEPVAPPPPSFPVEPLPSDPATPVPVVTGPPPVPGPAPTPTQPNAAAMFQRGAESLRPPPVDSGTLNPFPAPAPTPPPKPRPTDPTAMQVDSLERRGEIAQELGEVESQAARERKGVLDQQIVDEDRAEKERAAVREREQKELAQSRAKQQSAMDAYVNHKVDQNRAWHNRSTGSKIMAGIGVALAGLGSAFSARAGRDVSASNPALDLIRKSIDDDVQLQLADRDKLRDVAGRAKDATSDLLAQHKDRESQYDALREAGRRRVALRFDQIAANMQDPAKKLIAENSAEELRGEAGVIGAARDQRDLENRRADKQVAISAGNLALARASHERGIFESDRDHEEGKRRFDVTSNAAYLDALAKAKEADDKGNKEAAEAARKEAAEIRDLGIGGGVKKVVVIDGKPEVVYEPLKDSKGNIWKAPTTLAPKLQVRKGKVDNLVKLMDDTVNLIEEHGHESDFARSPAWQEMQTNWSSMVINDKTIDELGVLAGPDLPLIAKKIGTADPTQVRDTIPGIRKARSNTLMGLNDDLRAAGYDGPAYDIKEQTQQGVRERSKNTPAGAALAAANVQLGSAGDHVAFRQAHATRQSKKGEAATEPLHAVALAGIGGLAALAKQGDQRALDNLTQIGNSDPRPEARKAAREYAKKAGVVIQWKGK